MLKAERLLTQAEETYQESMRTYECEPSESNRAAFIHALNAYMAAQDTYAKTLRGEA